LAPMSPGMNRQRDSAPPRPSFGAELEHFVARGLGDP
jgi:hypothetical protein